MKVTRRKAPELEQRQLWATRHNNRLLLEKLGTARKSWAALGSFAALRMTLQIKIKNKSKSNDDDRSNGRSKDVAREAGVIYTRRLRAE
jgi:hypothetical protein